MALITFDDIHRSRSQRYAGGLMQKSAGQILNEASEAASSTQNFDVFLSHSYSDAQLDNSRLLGIKSYLEDYGLTVYVDWIVDHELDRKTVTETTAKILRRRMTHSRCLLFATSETSINSKWMPWELGYKDGQSATGGTTGMVAILPLANNSTSSFKGQEYLGLYPHIEKANDTFQNERLWVVEEVDTYVVLEAWLDGHAPTKRP